jgi:anthranilate phosphoribosyltransferase
MNYFQFQNKLLEGEIPTEQILQTFKYIEKNPLTKADFLDIYNSSIAKTIKIETNYKTIDIVGTGGDTFDTFNISTIAAILFSRINQDSNLKVAKHGNRSASSQVGSADLVESLGIALPKNSSEVVHELQKNNFAFLFAPYFNPSFKFAKEARSLFGNKTYFNLLGPLLNPTEPQYMLIGLYDMNLVDFWLAILPQTKVQKAWIVRGRSGINEIDPTGTCDVVEFDTLKGIQKFQLQPEDFGLESVPRESIVSGDLEHNSRIAQSILDYSCTDQNLLTPVFINIAAMMFVTNQTLNLKQGISICQNFYQNQL